MFTKKKTTFRLGRGKAGTARAVVCRELGVRRSYTLEVSFMGGVGGRHRGAQFTTRDPGQDEGDATSLQRRPSRSESRDLGLRPER